MDGMTRKRASALIAAGFLVALCSCSNVLVNELSRLASEANQPKAVPPEGTIITAHEMIKLTFPQAMDPASVSVSGSIGTGSLYWPPSGTNKELDLNFNDQTHPPAVAWNPGSAQKLIVNVKSSGETVSYTYTYTVFPGVCVSLPTNTPYPGASAAPGTALSPLATIHDGIAKAQTLYSSGPAAVAVAVGSYSATSTDLSKQITMVEGISLLGGYATDFKSRSASPAGTTITDDSLPSTTVDTQTIFCDATITTSTTINGFTIVGSGAKQRSFAIGCAAGASPTISNNVILAGTNNPSGDASTYRAAIGAGFSGSSGFAAPVISGNTINGDPSCGGINVGECYGIYLFGGLTGAADIVGNTIYGGSASLTGFASGVAVENVQAVRIRNNTIQGGDALTSAGIHVFNSPSQPIDVNNNLILTGTCPGTTGTAYAVYLYTAVNNVTLRNNTIIGTDHGTQVNQLICLFSKGANPVFDNNILLVQHHINNNPCYALYDTAASPSYTARNNDFFVTDVATDFVYHYGSTNTQIPPGTASITDNPSLDSSYKPSSSVSTVCTGGLDGAALGWSFTTDKNGATRTGNGTTGWSMGCFEVN